MIELTVKEELDFLQKVENWIEKKRHKKRNGTWSMEIYPPDWMKYKSYSSLRSSIYWWNAHNWNYNQNFKEIIGRMRSNREAKLKDVKEWQKSNIFKKQKTLDGKIVESKVDYRERELIRQKSCLSPFPKMEVDE